MKSIFNKEKRKKFIIKLKNKYHLVIMNDDTLEKKFSFKLTPMNVFVTIGTSIILLIFGTTYIIAFTPLREYIPGYADVSVTENVRKLVKKIDILEKDVKTKDLYIQNIKNIIQDINPNNNPKPNENVKEQNNTNTIKIEQTSNITKGTNNSFFFTPVNGIIVNSFNVKAKHYGVDIVAPKDQFIKATLDGMVILSTWTLETGNIIAIQHNNNTISIYKHNSRLLKKEGEFVKAGTPIAIIGNSGELTSGPHLHFEIWTNGIPINPKEIINFK
jgi:murein DD-endopeptidase MepM/ murein hydrolase activator NlpD